MYRDPFPVFEFIAGVISLAMIITFFVMARRLLLIKREVESVRKILRHQAAKGGILIIGKCPDCGRLMEIFGEEPAWCPNCQVNAKPLVTDKQTKQTEDNPQ